MEEKKRTLYALLIEAFVDIGCVNGVVIMGATQKKEEEGGLFSLVKIANPLLGCNTWRFWCACEEGYIARGSSFLMCLFPIELARSLCNCDPPFFSVCVLIYFYYVMGCSCCCKNRGWDVSRKQGSFSIDTITAGVILLYNNGSQGRGVALVKLSVLLIISTPSISAWQHLYSFIMRQYRLLIKKNMIGLFSCFFEKTALCVIPIAAYQI